MFKTTNIYLKILQFFLFHQIYKTFNNRVALSADNLKFISCRNISFFVQLDGANNVKGNFSGLTGNIMSSITLKLPIDLSDLIMLYILLG